MSLLTEVLVVSGVALDLVGAGVLAHAHNAESVAELRENIGEEGSALGEDDALSTHSLLLAEKRIGFFLLAGGLLLYLTGLVVKSSADLAVIAPVAAGTVIVGLAVSVLFTKVVGKRVRDQVRQAEARNDPDALPEQ
ncbi:hypothetical protein ABIE44_001916 [Marmoricola sp. OAE513]|uniref:hypothetical protein n=1 Tax=Marmoricola sp. OAE513 TaxID=2817894 RepID=UPI001AE99822